MKTKAYHKFLTRAAHFDADLELIDGISIMQNNGQLYSTGNLLLFDFIDVNRHPRLSNRTSSSHNRGIAVNHLKNSLYSSYIKDIYEEIATYFQEILKAAARNGFDPNRLIGEHKVSFDANDLLSAGSWQAVIDLVASAVFRKLENERSTINILKKMDSKLDLGVNQSKIDAALPFLEIRHLLIHADGIADSDFCSKYPLICSSAGSKLKLTYPLISSARTAIFELAEEYDNRIITKNVVGPNDLKL